MSLIVTIHLPLADQGNSPCPEAVVTLGAGICRQLISSAGEDLDTTTSPFHLRRLGKPCALQTCHAGRSGSFPLSRSYVWFPGRSSTHRLPQPASFLCGGEPSLHGRAGFWTCILQQNSVCLSTICLGLLVALGDSCLQRA